MQTIDNTAFLNGEYLPLKDVTISPFDRGFLFGDSIYEVVPFYNQKAVGGDIHYQRLLDGLSSIGIASPYQTIEEWKQQLHPLLSDEHEFEMLYIQVTRGVEASRKHRFPVTVKPTVFAFVMVATPPITIDYRGAKAYTYKDLRWQRCDIKSTSLLGNILPYYDLYQRGAEKDEAILCRNGHAVEAPSSNVFAVIDGVIVTPPLDNILVGVTRALVIEDAKKLGLPIVECPLPVENLANAEEIWVTNSYEELKPIVILDDMPVGQGTPGPMWKKLYQAFQERKI